MIRNILICTTQVPFTSGGAEAHVEGLRRALTEAGYNAEVVALPFKWYPPSEIMRSALAWRLLDLTEANGKPVDLVIGMKFPAYLVAHPRKVLWIIHQYRSAYNLWDTRFDDLSTYSDGAQVREWIRQASAWGRMRMMGIRCLRYCDRRERPGCRGSCASRRKPRWLRPGL